MRQRKARAGLTIRDGRAYTEVRDLRNGSTLVTDHGTVRIWQKLLDEARVDVAAFDRVIFAGHSLKDWDDLTPDDWEGRAV
ncbi:hypothetical protein [Citricoccus sp. K5]|uniref:hypothetical protein n=1 Tax=Citricoccus sp. K5 TaxID=2653135 RepID=UPI0012F1D240|nr:hypothetical protein [Citricoccus sp. K5]VXA92697.1 hypothetical protein CITRIK5_100033 [Citricoccus sp. K5]VXA95228.1 hypothetical protein CITRIK5_100099 [Citricoccus sp. K5]